MSTSGKPLYQPLDWLLVRTPLLPVGAYLDLAARPDWPAPTGPDTLLPADASVRRALLVGAGDLARALEHPPKTDRQRRKLAGKLLRYLIRMSTRPTPYGLFAGVGIGRWGERTDLAVAADRPRTRTRPDMGWLLDLVSTVEQRPEMRSDAHCYTNPLALVHSGRVHLPGPAAVSMRATGAVSRVLARAATPVARHELVDELSSIPGATPAKIDTMLDELLRHGVLLTDLRPPLTVTEPARYVADRLARTPAGRPVAAALTELLDAMRDWDELDDAEGGEQHAKLVAQASSIHPVKDTPIQVDTALPLTGSTVQAAVGAAAANAAELLLRLSPAPAPRSALDGYRHRFRARYGPDAQVPILELLDPSIGLGPPQQSNRAATGDQQRRHRALLDLALGAIRDGRRVVELDEPLIDKLSTSTPNPATVPSSLDISVFVAAESAEAMDSGEFQVVVGPNLGAMGAGRVLGRFADMLGEQAIAGLRAAAAADSVANPGRLPVEIGYLPARDRSANVAIRPLVRQHQIAIGTVPDPQGERIDVAELTVTVRDDQFVVRCPRLDIDVLPRTGHMLSTWQAPAVAQFLDQVGRDGLTQLNVFDWGPATGFPFLPRVQCGRVVLALARWRVDAEELPPDQFPEALAEWRERWSVPRYVYLSVGDNRLLLDLDDPAQAEQLRDELGGVNASRGVTVQEALPGPDQAWLPGATGPYLSELVVPLIVTTPRPASTNAPLRTARSMTPLPSHRLRVPGSDWLYAKLYCPPEAMTDLIRGPIRTFCAEACATGLADDWFFIRYADPDPHLRIRLHGDPAKLTTRLAPELLRWGADLVEDARFVLDTYDREIERYGGPAGMLIAEELFGVDSRLVAELLDLPDRVDERLLAMLTVDGLLAGLGVPNRLDWYRQLVPDRRAASAEYREHQRDLRTAFGDPNWHPGPTLQRILDNQFAALRPIGERLDAIADQLWQPKEQLARSFVHMHCNRLLASGTPREYQTLALLLRTKESLHHAPIPAKV